MSRRWIFGGSFLSCPIEAVDFIAAHETATGVSMDAIQKNAVCGLVSRLKGNDTTNGSDLWTAFVSAGTELWPLAPSSDSVASADGCRVELMSATQKGTYLNFVSGDFAPNGVTGGSTKYFRTTTNSDSFPQNDVAHGVMISQRNDTVNAILAGNDNGSNTNQVNLSSRAVRTDAVFRVNDGGTPTVSGVPAIPGEGLFVIQRADATDKTYHVNGALRATISGAFIWPTAVSRPLGFHAFLRQTSVPLANSSDRFSFYLYGMPSLTANEHQDLFDALNWYQANVITGGR